MSTGHVNAARVPGARVASVLLFVLYVDPVAWGDYINVMVGSLIVSLVVLCSGFRLMRR